MDSLAQNTPFGPGGGGEEATSHHHSPPPSPFLLLLHPSGIWGGGQLIPLHLQLDHCSSLLLLFTPFPYFCSFSPFFPIFYPYFYSSFPLITFFSQLAPPHSPVSPLSSPPHPSFSFQSQIIFFPSSSPSLFLRKDVSRRRPQIWPFPSGSRPTQTFLPPSPSSPPPSHFGLIIIHRWMAMANKTGGGGDSSPHSTWDSHKSGGGEEDGIFAMAKAEGGFSAPGSNPLELHGNMIYDFPH